MHCNVVHAHHVEPLHTCYAVASLQVLLSQRALIVPCLQLLPPSTATGASQAGRRRGRGRFNGTMELRTTHGCTSVATAGEMRMPACYAASWDTLAAPRLPARNMEEVQALGCRKERLTAQAARLRWQHAPKGPAAPATPRLLAPVWAAGSRCPHRRPHHRRRQRRRHRLPLRCPHPARRRRRHRRLSWQSQSATSLL